MPNWVHNNVKLSGPAAVIQQLIADKFDFFKINSPPTEDDIEWCRKHWTADRNCDMETFMVENMKVDGRTANAIVNFRTAWSTPYALFAFLTKVTPDLRITVHYQGDACAGFEGRTEYAEGRIQDVFIDVSKNSGAALRKFKQHYPWFDYETWEILEYCLDETGDGKYQCSERSGAYDEMVTR